MKNKNEYKYYLNTALAHIVLMMVNGSVMQACMLEIGIGAGNVSFFVSAMQFVQVVIMMSFSKAAERIKKVIDTNVFGTIAMIKGIFPIMHKQGKGQIININSQSGVMCEPPFPIYNATKHSTNAFRKAIQDDLARNNIKITDVCPGLIKTDFYVRANNKLPDEIMETGLTPEDVAKTVKYVFDLPHEITIPSIEVRHIKNY